MDFQPTKGKLLVKDVEDTKTTKSGFHLANKEKTYTADIILSGPETEFKPGETVMYTPYQPIKVTIDDQEYLILNQEDVLLVRGNKS